MSEPFEANFQPPPPPPTPVEEPPAPRPTKLRPVAIGLFAIGLLVLVGGIAKFIAGGAGTGGALCFMGILLFALSFIPLPKVQEEPPMSPVQKLISIFYEPTRVFRNLRSHPRWGAAFIVIVVLSVIYTFAFTQRITPDRIVNHNIDKLAELGPPFAPPPETLDTMRAQQLEDAKNPVQRVGNAVKALVAAFVFTCFSAAVYMLAVLAFGGRINFWQSLAVGFYATLPYVAIQKVISLVILYIKAPEDLHPILGQEGLIQDNLGILFTPSEHPVLFVMASMIGILSFYSLWLRAKGLQNGGTRVSSSQAWGASIAIWVLFLIFVSSITALFPTFIG
jgi:Yip1 domain